MKPLRPSGGELGPACGCQTLVPLSTLLRVIHSIQPQRLRRASPMVSGRMYCEEGCTRRSNEPRGREFDGGKGDAQKPGPEGTVPDKTRRP